MQEIISSQNCFFLAIFFFAFGALGSLVFNKNDVFANYWGNTFAMVASVFGLISSLSVLLFDSIFSYTAYTTLPYVSLSFMVDKLAAFFIFLISLIALWASVYGIGYTKHYYRKYNIGILGFFYNIFIAGMFMVVSAHNALFFLIVWELMSLASYFLVIFENKEPENIKSGTLYFVMTHIGTAFIIMMFLLFYRATGTFDFALIKSSITSISPVLKNTIFILALIGFGTKAGIIPFHIWLPSAHPAAPSHVSALMSGVMIKTGIYMFIRIFFDIMPSTPIWWGVLILIVGAISSLLGVLYALAENDIKRLLAYSSIENIGIILLALGGSFIFSALDMKSLAMIGLVAALFHIFNHAVFKALLFMGAGSVIMKTHTRNIEEYGGLIRLMPQTAFFFLMGSMAISALPPLNGFFSEWLTFQTLFSGILSSSNSIQLVFILAAGSLAFTGGLAAACFVKVFGITFLARPRSEKAKHAKESDISLQLGMAVFASFTIIIGFFSGNISAILLNIVKSLEIFRFSELPFFSNTNGLILNNQFAALSMPIVFITLIGAIAFVYLAMRSNHKGQVKYSRTWDCGSDLTPKMEITGTGFSRSIITIFQNVLKPSKQHDIEYQDAQMRYFQKSYTVTMGRKNIYGMYLYGPTHDWLLKITGYAKRLQSGNVNLYIMYVFFVLIALLIFAVV